MSKESRLQAKKKRRENRKKKMNRVNFTVKSDAVKEAEQILKFMESKTWRKFYDNPFNPNHELAHKKVIDHFFPNDQAEIFTDSNGRPMTGNKWMKSHTVSDINYEELPIQDKILISGYVQEIIDLNFDSNLEMILKTQILNTIFTAEFYILKGDRIRAVQNCFTNDDGKFFLYHDKFGDDPHTIMNKYIEAGKWCYNFLKNN